MSAYCPELSQQMAALVETLVGKHVCVIGHARPDGDCIGSQVAMARLLRAQGAKVELANADPLPEPLLFLAEKTPVARFDFDAIAGLPLIYVDCADQARVGPVTSQKLSGARHLANIDHHISNTLYAETNLLDATSAATCEIIAGIAFDLGWEIDLETAQALYVGIMADTGRFCYASASSRVFELCSRLVALGARPDVASQHLFENDPLSRYKLLQRYLSSLELHCDGKVCCGVLTQNDFEQTQSSYDETEGFVDYARSLKGVEVGIIIEERATSTKGSLRAMGADIRVDQVAAQFGGGGHARAAGLSSSLTVEALKEGLLKEIDRRMKAMSN